MSDDYRTSHTPLWRRGALILGVITLAAAALALIGWALDVPALYRVFATWPPMVPATALSFVLVGGALALLALARRTGARAALGQRGCQWACGDQHVAGADCAGRPA